MPAHSGSALPTLRHLPASLPVEGAVRIELQDGVPVLRASTVVQRRIATLSCATLSRAPRFRTLLGCPRRRSLPRKMQVQVRERARALCEYCHTAEQWQYVPFTVDHIVPLAQGGLTIPENLA
jgi:5-methylcytosine-specific restriction endonuclease McrA